MIMFISAAMAQKEVFDLVGFVAPQGWNKEVRETLTIFTTIDQQKKTWCQVAIVKSTTSKGSIEQDFVSEWQELVVKNYNPAQAAAESVVVEAEGWKVKSGSAGFSFNHSDAFAILTTFSGYDRCASIVITSISQAVFCIDTGTWCTGIQQVQNSCSFDA